MKHIVQGNDKIVLDGDIYIISVDHNNDYCLIMVNE